MTGPVAGNLSSGTSTCQVFTASRRFDYLLGTKMSGKGLLLTLTVYSNFTTSGAGSLAVRSDGKSGSTPISPAANTSRVPGSATSSKP